MTVEGVPTIYFLDVEANSLALVSFPIEIAWIDQDGMGESHLIRPADTWLGDGCNKYSAESEKVHGISLRGLLAKELSAIEVALTAIEVLSAHRAIVYSEEPALGRRVAGEVPCCRRIQTTAEVRDVKKACGVTYHPLLASLSRLEDFTRERMEPNVRTYARAIIARTEEL